jgi:hypothetical protein
MLAANLDLQQRSGPYYFDNNGICILAAQPSYFQSSYWASVTKKENCQRCFIFSHILISAYELLHFSLVCT